MSKAHGLSVPQESLRARYAEGLAAYRAQRFDEARAAFNAALEAVPGDGPSRTLLGRIAQFEANPPDAIGTAPGGWSKIAVLAGLAPPLLEKTFLLDNDVRRDLFLRLRFDVPCGV